MEILTQANAILGFNQCSLAKFLCIVAENDDPRLDVDDIPSFFYHLLSRVGLAKGPSFQTRTPWTTLDYSGTGINAGSKLVIAAAGPVLRELNTQLPKNLGLVEGFREPGIALPGVMAIQGPKFGDYGDAARQMAGLTACLESQNLQEFPLLVVVDDSRFTTANINNFLWVTFTRANPSHDCYGVKSFTSFNIGAAEGP